MSLHLYPLYLPNQILSEWFGRSVIRSCVKLSYDHAQSMIEAPEKMFLADELPPVDPEHPIDEIHQAVLNLHSIAKNLRAQRFSGGALRLDQVSPPSLLFDHCLLVTNKIWHRSLRENTIHSWPLTSLSFNPIEGTSTKMHFWVELSLARHHSF